MAVMLRIGCRRFMFGDHWGMSNDGPHDEASMLTVGF